MGAFPAAVPFTAGPRFRISFVPAGSQQRTVRLPGSSGRWQSQSRQVNPADGKSVLRQARPSELGRGTDHAKVGSTFAGRQRQDRMLRFAHAHEPQQDLRSKHLGNQAEGVVGILVVAAMLALLQLDLLARERLVRDFTQYVSQDVERRLSSECATYQVAHAVSLARNISSRARE